MIANNEGLTKTYNRFHSPDERDEGILELRRLHGLMDGAVLRAYGWDDLAESAAADDFCQFLLDYEEEEDDESPATGPIPIIAGAAKRKSPGVIAGPTTSAMKSSPASSNSTNNATKKSSWPAWRRRKRSEKTEKKKDSQNSRMPLFDLDDATSEVDS